MLGHRKLTVEDYLGILKRRRLLIAVPLLLTPIVAVIATKFIPAQYMSQTLVLIEEQRVAAEFVKPVLSSDLDTRLASMKEQILSRSRIQPIIERYNLYGTEHMTMDDRIDRARKNINIKPIHSEIAHAGGLPGFFISFKAGDAHTAQLVCGEITSLFLSENLRSREASAEGTTDFLKGQMEDAKRNLDEQESKLATFQKKYIGKLPGQEEPNMNMLSSLGTQLEASTQALARMEQDKTYAESMLSQQTASQPVVSPSSPGPLVGTFAQQAELDKLRETEADLLTHYTASYPDVIAVRRKIAALHRQMTPNATGTGRVASVPDTPAIQQLRAQIRSAEVGINAKRKEQAQIQGQLRMYQDRIQSSPDVQEEFKSITRDHETAQKFYDDLLTKMNHSKMATDLERRQEGEQFRVMDEPNLPDSPTFPKRWIFGISGLGFGLALGLIIIAVLEYKDTSLRSDRDIWAFTRLPTLAVVAFTGPDSQPVKPTGFFDKLKELTK